MAGSLYSFLAAEPSAHERYFDLYRSSGVFEPEHALLLAILEDAIDSFHKYRTARARVGRERFREAQQWLMDDGTDWIFSFENVCRLLGLEPDYVRRGLRQLDKEPNGNGEQHRKGHRRREL